MKINITKEWKKIPMENVCTLYIPNDTEIFLETTKGDVPTTEGILYRQNEIQICTQDNVYIKLSDVNKFDNMDINYVNFI